MTRKNIINRNSATTRGFVMSNNEFQYLFFCGLFYDCYKVQDNNTDFLMSRYSTLSRLKNRLQDKILALASRAGFVYVNPFTADKTIEHFTFILKHIDELERFYYLLQDDQSRQLLIELLKFRILGKRHVKLPLNDEKYWDKYTSINRNFLQERRTIRTWRWYLNRYKLQGLNGPINLHTYSLGILNIFLLEQYAYKKGHGIIQVQPGDVIIDAGGCWGDTALYFANKTGAQGKVYCFEFVQDNLEIIQQNLSLNQHLADRIEVVPKALWDESGETVSYCASGPATSLVFKQQGALQVPTLSIDDFVKEEGIKRVDFIKMDIEGSELKALQGAEETIRTFRPKLAISLYHRDDDFIVIPDYLDKLGLRYEFFLDHFTIHRDETVLFACPTVISNLSNRPVYRSDSF